MKLTFFTTALLATFFSTVYGQEILFQDNFRGKLGEGWGWVHEHPEGWRLTERGLEVRIEPGNMWRPQNDARNVLVRPAPDPSPGEIEVSVNVENKSTCSALGASDGVPRFEGPLMRSVLLWRFSMRPTAQMPGLAVHSATRCGPEQAGSKGGAQSQER